MRRNLLWVLVAVFAMAGMAFAGTPTAVDKEYMTTAPSQNVDELDEIIWIEDFEGDVSDWVHFDPAADFTVWWDTDDYMASGGTNAWRVFDPALGNNGGYNNDWMQLYRSQTFSTQGLTSLDLTFDMMLKCESGNWDGATVLVYYGNDPNNLAWEYAPSVTPAYTETSLYAFELFGVVGVEGWAADDLAPQPFMTAFETVSVDLSSYIGYDYVSVGIAFASDGAYCTPDEPTMYGLIVDEIVLADNNGTVWADDADGGTVGTGEFLAGAAVVGDTPVPQQWDVVAAGGAYADPPSPTMVAAVTQDVQGFDHYFEYTGTFNLPAINPGEDLWLDVWFNNDFEDNGAWPLAERYYWRPEVFDPNTGQWWAASNVGGWSGTNYVYVGSNGAVWEPFSESGFTYDWTLNELAGTDGVKVRLFFHSPTPDRTFSHHAIDDVFVESTALQHDLSSMLHIPYPTTINYDVYGEGYITNNGPNQETGWLAIWVLDGPTYPMLPDTQQTIDPGETLTFQVNDPTDPDHVGYWYPDASGEYALNINHTLTGDEIPENNTFPVSVDVKAMDMYELGVDSRNQTTSLSIHNLNDGPVVHIMPGMYDAMFNGAAFDINSIELNTFFHSAAGGAGVDPSMDFKVYAGGDTPGALIWTGTYNFVGVNPGDTGQYYVNFDVSAVPELQGLSGDFWLQAVFTDWGNAGEVYPQPFAYRYAASVPEYQDNQYYEWADANDGIPNADFGHHLTATVTNVSPALATLVLTPDNTTVPAGGGPINYEVAFNSNLGITVPGVLYWENAQLPGGAMTQRLFQLQFTHTPNMSVTANRVLNVPGFAPAGTYTFYGKMGLGFNNPLIMGSFQFTKDAAVAGAGGEWSTSGETFETAGEEAAAVSLPTEYAISDAYPNPFNPSTSLAISLPETAELNVTVFNVMGQQVATLANSTFNAGTHTLTFDASNLSSGLYFIKAEVPGQLNELRKVTLMK